MKKKKTILHILYYLPCTRHLRLPDIKLKIIKVIFNNSYVTFHLKRFMLSAVQVDIHLLSMNV